MNLRIYQLRHNVTRTWILLVISVLFAVSVVSWRAAKPQQALASALSADYINLGDLSPSQSREFEIKLRNHGRTNLAINPPTTACGCISSKKTAFVIAAGEEISIPFELKAPDHPGFIRKEISFSLASRPDFRWTSEIVANVVTDIWSSPREINLQYYSLDAAQSEVIVNHDETLRVLDVSSRSDHISINTIRLSPTTIKVIVSIDATNAKSGNEDICVSLSDNRPPFKIRVHWSAKPAVVFSPAILVINGERKEELKQTVLVYKGQKARSGALKFESLVPWVRIVNVSDSGKIVSMQCSLNSGLIPDNFNAAVLRVVLDGAEPAVNELHLHRRHQ